MGIFGITQSGTTHRPLYDSLPGGHRATQPGDSITFSRNSQCQLSASHLIRPQKLCARKITSLSGNTQRFSETLLGEEHNRGVIIIHPLTGGGYRPTIWDTSPGTPSCENRSQFSFKVTTSGVPKGHKPPEVGIRRTKRYTAPGNTHPHLSGTQQ